MPRRLLGASKRLCVSPSILRREPYATVFTSVLLLIGLFLLLLLIRSFRDSLPFLVPPRSIGRRLGGGVRVDARATPNDSPPVGGRVG
jgi:hypothetical protein